MSLSEQLANLVRTGQLKPHQPAPGEIRSHLDNARDGLRDAARADNSLGSRFRLANDAGHDLLTAKLKMLGYRTGSERGHRDILYQLLDSMLPGAANAKAVLHDVHRRRNRAIYDGDSLEVSQGMVDALIAALQSVREEVEFDFRKFMNSAGNRTS